MDKLIKKRKSTADPPIFYVTIEETFDVIRTAHLDTGHGGRDRMLKELNQKFANVHRESVELFKSFCKVCQEKTKRQKTKGVVVRPILSSDFSSRGQVDLIDFQSMDDGQYKWIMVYQDHLTKFVVLRPLTSKRACEVAFQLMDIFALLGAPVILQSDNGSEFTAAIIKELRELWPELRLVHGKPRHPQSQGSVERANGDIKDMLIAWMADNTTTRWSVGLRFVQFMKNRSYSAAVKRSPYQALFGCQPRVGLSSTSLPKEMIDQFNSEDDLRAVSLQNTADVDSQLGRADVENSFAADTVPPQVCCATAVDIVTSQINDVADFDTLQINHADIAAEINHIPETATPQSSHCIQESENDETDNIVALLDRQCQQIHHHREASRVCQVQQAERMVKRSRLDLGHGQRGDNVAIPVPLVDRGRGDPRNILGVILDRSENDNYTLVTKYGILRGAYTRNEFELCPQRLLSLDAMNCIKHVSLREAVILGSQNGGQGYIKCNCSGIRKCQSNRCKCFKAKLKCNSRCHQSLNCSNKICS